MPLTTRRIWGIRIGVVAWFIAGVGFLLGVPILLQAWWAAFPLLVLLAVLLALPIAWIWKRFVSHRRLRPAWIKAAIAVTFALTILLASPVYYFAFLTQLKPALVPQVTLTNGNKQIVFQGMQHVGSERFYQHVVFDLEDALTRGFILFYEGVSPSSPDNDRWFDRTVTGGQDLTQSYRDLGRLCGLRFQSDFLQVVVRDQLVHPGNHVVADVSTAQLRTEYDRLMKADPAFSQVMAARVPDSGSSGFEKIVEFLRSGTDGQREIAGTICRGFMTMVMNRSNDPAVRDDLDALILDYRNRVLARRLLIEPRRRIYVTYGAKHLAGLFGLLKQADPTWRVASVKWVRTIDAPESYSATLPGITN